MQPTNGSRLGEILGYHEYFYTRLLGTIPLLGGIPSGIFEAIHAYENWNKDTTPIKALRIFRILSLPFGGPLWTVADVIYEIYTRTFNKAEQPKEPEPPEVEAIAKQRAQTKLELREIERTLTSHREELLNQVKTLDASKIQSTAEEATQRWELEVNKEVRKAKRSIRRIKTHLNDAREAVGSVSSGGFLLKNRLDTATQSAKEYQKEAVAAGTRAIEAAKSILTDFTQKSLQAKRSFVQNFV
jgi:hypothetical protein